MYKIIEDKTFTLWVDELNFTSLKKIRYWFISSYALNVKYTNPIATEYHEYFTKSKHNCYCSVNILSKLFICLRTHSIGYVMEIN